MATSGMADVGVGEPDGLHVGSRTIVFGRGIRRSDASKHQTGPH